MRDQKTQEPSLTTMILVSIVVLVYAPIHWVSTATQRETVTNFAKEKWRWILKRA